jgi:hypothetical protein
MNRNLVLATFGALLTVCLAQRTHVSEVHAASAQVQKKVRLTNNTTDTEVRMRCVGFKRDVHFTLTVPRNQQKIETGVFVGDRGVIVYETLNEKVIATGQFELTAAGMNVDVEVKGDMTNGYTLAATYQNF